MFYYNEIKLIQFFFLFIFHSTTAPQLYITFLYTSFSFVVLLVPAPAQHHYECVRGPKKTHILPRHCDYIHCTHSPTPASRASASTSSSAPTLTIRRLMGTAENLAEVWDEAKWKKQRATTNIRETRLLFFFQILLPLSNFYFCNSYIPALRPGIAQHSIQIHISSSSYWMGTCKGKHDWMGYLFCSVTVCTLQLQSLFGTQRSISSRVWERESTEMWSRGAEE